MFTYFNSLNAISGSTTMASGGISGVSMILCCTHYILNLLPFLGAIVGMSWLVSLSKYTVYFLLFGILFLTFLPHFGIMGAALYDQTLASAVLGGVIFLYTLVCYKIFSFCIKELRKNDS